MGVDRIGILQLRLAYNAGVAFSLDAGLPAWVAALNGLFAASRHW
jgi:lipoprotein signal peptidase